jgi:hypothetical protein
MRRDTLHLTKTISDFFRQYSYNILDNKTISFYLRELATTPRSSRKHDDHGASPPSSEIMPKHDEDIGGIGEKVSADRWG